MKRNIFFRPERCLLCLSCVLACQRQSLREEPGKDPRPRLRATFSGGTPWVWKCQQCTAAPCVEACISGSLRPREDGTGTEHSPENCVGCGSCLLACPLGIPAPEADSHRFSRCRLCLEEETPPCVKVCQSGALVFEEAGRFARTKMKRYALTAEKAERAEKNAK